MTAVRSTILDIPDTPPHPGRRMTEMEFIQWCTPDTWAEWVDGEVIVMSPVNLQHAQLFSFLMMLLGAFIEQEDLGQLLTEPFQVRFGRMRRRRSPDIFYDSAARSHLIENLQIQGAPDLIIEIVSPSSQSRDRREKYLEYMAAGVREYWIIDPLSETVEVHTLLRGRYKLIAETEGRIDSTVLEGFFLRPDWLWRDKFPRISDLMRQMKKVNRPRRRKS